MAMKSLHPGAKWHFRLNGFFSSLFFIFFILILLGGLLSTEEGIFNFLSVMFFVLIVVFVLFVELYAQLSYKFFKYEFTQNQLRVEKGIIWRKYSNIPYQRIQNIDITRGVVARLCGFSSVNVQTAGYSLSAGGSGVGRLQSEGYIPAVSVKEAEEIRDFLIKKISKNNKSGL